MNRRRFLSLLGLLPAALALPSMPAATRSSGIKIIIRGPMNDFRSDLQYATILAGLIAPPYSGPPYLVGESGPEIIIPPKRWIRPEEV